MEFDDIDHLRSRAGKERKDVGPVVESMSLDLRLAVAACVMVSTEATQTYLSEARRNYIKRRDSIKQQVQVWFTAPMHRPLQTLAAFEKSLFPFAAILCLFVQLLSTLYENKKKQLATNDTGELTNLAWDKAV